jgi:hypothetical protein
VSKPVAAPTGGVPARPRRRPSIVEIALIIVVVVIAIIAIVMMSRACSGPQASTYLPAEAAGTWATTVQIMVPQIVDGEGWRTACEADGSCTVSAGSCEMREREDRFSEREVENYDDYGYSIYFEESTKQLFEAAGSDFTVTRLNPDEDRWEGERHYVSVEWLDRETCEYTNFTLWITDPDDTSQEVEVVLSECEVWDHVVVTEKVYEQEEFCQTQTVQGLTVLNTLTEQGSGYGVDWPAAVTPQGGELQSQFKGTVVFQAEGTEHSITVTDPDAYVRYLTVPQYLGLDEDGQVVRVTDRVPE